MADPNWNHQFDDRYFNSSHGAGDNGLLERLHVFIQANQLVDRVVSLTDSRPLIVGELGFGSGLNLLALAMALKTVSASPKPVAVHWYTVEHQRLAAENIGRLLAEFTVLSDLLPPFLTAYQQLTARQTTGGIVWEGKVDFGWVSFDLIMLQADVSQFPSLLPAAVDAWLLDGHDPAKNPAMWTEALFGQLRLHSHAQTTLSSWTAAGTVKRALRVAGFTVVRRPGFGRKRHMIVGSCEAVVQEFLPRMDTD